MRWCGFTCIVLGLIGRSLNTTAYLGRKQCSAGTAAGVLMWGAINVKETVSSKADALETIQQYAPAVKLVPLLRPIKVGLGSEKENRDD